MNVGFIGLGHMGRAMAVNLGKAGHDVRAWNRTREATVDLASKGLSFVSTPDEAFAGDAVISMQRLTLPAGRHISRWHRQDPHDST